MGIEWFWLCQRGGEPRAWEAGTEAEGLRLRFVIRIEEALRRRFWVGSTSLDVVLQQCAAERQFLFASTISQNAELPDAHKAAGQDSRAAVANRCEGFSLMSTKHVAPSREELCFVGAEDIGHFGPMLSHRCGGRALLLRTRSIPHLRHR